MAGPANPSAPPRTAQRAPGSATARGWLITSLAAALVAACTGDEAPYPSAAGPGTGAGGSGTTTGGESATTGGNSAGKGGGDGGRGGSGGEPCEPLDETPPMGTSCMMNVGNADFLDSLARAYTYKVKSCAVLEERVTLLDDRVCDVVGLVELLGDEQCRCACDDPGKDVARCADAGWVPNEPRCELCQGCGSAAPSATPGCVNQAAVVCDPARYDIHCSTSADPVGCDCLCMQRPGDCGLVNDPAAAVFSPPEGCDQGQQALCATRRHPGSGTVLMASCVVHPSHCTGALGTDEGCIADCHSTLLTQAFDYVTSFPAARQLLIGDWNCGAAGECNYPGPDYCMWEAMLPDYGLAKCPWGELPTAEPNWLHTTPCILDFAVSNGCPSCDQRVLPVEQGDHALVVVGEPCEP